MTELSTSDFRTARDALIDEGFRLGRDDAIQAADLLTTAGFSILAVTLGLDNAREALPHMMASFLDDLPTPN